MEVRSEAVMAVCMAPCFAGTPEDADTDALTLAMTLSASLFSSSWFRKPSVFSVGAPVNLLDEIVGRAGKLELRELSVWSGPSTSCGADMALTWFALYNFL